MQISPASHHGVTLNFSKSQLQSVVVDGFLLEQIAQGLLSGSTDLLPAVAVAGEGYALSAVWPPVDGATRAEVTTAVARIGVAVAEEPLGELALAHDGRAYVLTIPGGKRIAALTLHGMRDAAGNLLTSRSDLPTVPEQHRLVVRAQEGNQPGPPLYAVPSSPARGMLPSSLTGASFSSGVLRLPNLAAPKLRLALVTRPYPDQFEEQPFTIERVTGVAAIFPTDLQLCDHQGRVLWSFPGEYPPGQPPFPFDLRTSFEPALNTALAAGQPLNLTFRLKGRAPGKAGLGFNGVRGFLVRDFPASPVLSMTLAGDPVRLPINQPLAAVAPTSVTADLSVRYSGIRLLDELSDSLPGGPVAGFVVAEEPVLRAYPPQALTSARLARLGLIGRATGAACELAVTLVRVQGSLPGPPLGPPAVLRLSAEAAFRTHWLELPPGLDLSRGELGVLVRANQGRFLWAADGNRPLLKLAIYDPEPGGRPLRLNGRTIYPVADAAAHTLPAYSFPPDCFQNQPPAFDSSLFLNVELSDLALRYAR